MSSGRREIRKPVTEEDIRKWEQEWSKMMVTIWKENITRLKIIDTGRLHDSLKDSVSNVGSQITIVHEFLQYGIYVARGVGAGYKRGNGGDLEILDKSYRKAHGMNKKRKTGFKDSEGNTRYTSGKARQRRDWFTPRYMSSINVLTEVETQLYGESYMGTFSNVVQAIFDTGNKENKVGISRTLSNM